MPPRPDDPVDPAAPVLPLLPTVFTLPWLGLQFLDLTLTLIDPLALPAGAPGTAVRKSLFRIPDSLIKYKSDADRAAVIMSTFNFHATDDRHHIRVDSGSGYPSVAAVAFVITQADPRTRPVLATDRSVRLLQYPSPTLVLGGFGAQVLDTVPESSVPSNVITLGWAAPAYLGTKRSRGVGVPFQTSPIDFTRDPDTDALVVPPQTAASGPYMSRAGGYLSLQFFATPAVVQDQNLDAVVMPVGTIQPAMYDKNTGATVAWITFDEPSLHGNRIAGIVGGYADIKDPNWFEPKFLFVRVPVPKAFVDAAKRL